MRTKARTATARKIVGSLGVIGTAAAVAGLGTFGTFTDSTTAVETQVQTGKVDINLTSAGYTVPASITNFVPGDSMTRAVTLTNDGTAPLSTVSLAVATTGTQNKLTTDTTNGLKLAVRSCSVAWTQSGPADAPTYACTGTSAVERSMVSGSVLGTTTLPTPASLTPGGTDHLVFTISLPTGADNTFQSLSSPLSLTFTGIQRNGIAR